jgi:2-oxoisovalerate dehydrogenase E1 component
LIDLALATRLYREMLRIRIVEQRIADRYADWEMRCPVHLGIGQEAAAVGACAALEPRDYVMSGHRSHGHYLAKGGDLKAMMAEIYGRATGCAGGKGGSMHLIDLACGFLGAAPIVGSTMAIALGAAFASRMRGEDRVTMVFFGDGATEAGIFHECLNFAALHQLAIIFVCENNLYSVYSPLEVRQPPHRPIVDLAAAHGIATGAGDGNDVEEVYRLARGAVDAARSGKGPAFIELATYRWLEHCGPNYDNDIGYRSEAEFEEWRERCPLKRQHARLIERGAAPAELDRMEAAAEQEFAAALKFAKASPEPERRALLADVTAPARCDPESEPATTTSRSLTFAEAIREAQDYCLGADASVYLIGLGAPDPKGIFGTTLGLQAKYGARRVLDMPLAENAMTGVAIGSAIVGMRPILTHQRVDFALLSMEQLVNQAAKFHYMFGGKHKVPMVVRMIIGRGWGQGPQHSQSLQSWFAHIPGLRVLMPTTAYDAKGLMIAAVEDDNPVVVLEHRWLHGIADLVPEAPYRVPLGKARVMREGGDVTIVAASYMTLEALRAADHLARLGLEAEVIDLRSLRPLDEATIVASVRKTGRLVVADTGWRLFGISAEIVALAAEQCFGRLAAPPQRVALPDAPTPTSKALADHFYPRWGHVAAAALATMGRATDPALLEPPPGVNLDQPDTSFTGPF